MVLKTLAPFLAWASLFPRRLNRFGWQEPIRRQPHPYARYPKKIAPRKKSTFLARGRQCKAIDRPRGCNSPHSPPSPSPYPEYPHILSARHAQAAPWFLKIPRKNHLYLSRANFRYDSVITICIITMCSPIGKGAGGRRIKGENKKERRNGKRISRVIYFPFENLKKTTAYMKNVHSNSEMKCASCPGIHVSKTHQSRSGREGAGGGGYYVPLSVK